MRYENRWLMPEGIEELLPPQAEHFERLRREVIDLFHSWGYELVVPPLIEYLESLLLGRGDDLDLQTYKLIDQLNGRLMGVRADITPQVARIDAHHLGRKGPARLCYVGTVLHTLPRGFAGTRQPIQIGAELYGYEGIEADVEVLHLMVETLALTGVEDVHVDLGHVGVFRSLAQAAELNADAEGALFEAMQRKAKADMVDVLVDYGVAGKWADIFTELVDLNGDADVLAEARTLLSDTDVNVVRAIDELEAVSNAVKGRLPDLPLNFDLAELRGYHYKTGVVFAAFVPGQGQELARGGRYNEIGREYGRGRPATGFSADLKTLIEVSKEDAYEVRAILAPYESDPSLHAQVRALRKQGERVVEALPDQELDLIELNCNRKLVRANGAWQVVPVD